MIPVGKSLMTLMTNDLNDHFFPEREVASFQPGVPKEPCIRNMGEVRNVIGF